MTVTPSTSPNACPCCSGKPLAACCGPYLAGERPAPTAEALMRSRYSAYATGAIDYIVDTHDAHGREEVDRDETTRWAREATWLGLEVVAVEGGGEKDDHGVVEFRARWSRRGDPAAAEIVHHERSRFHKHGERWFYVDGDMVKPKPVRAEATPGRNDPCHCGSGKKFKRCHGA